MSKGNNMIKPVVILVIICAIAGCILAVVHAKTQPLIDANDLAAKTATYKETLPEAEDFEELSCDIEGVTAVLKSTNDVGYVITAQSRGYGGQVPVAVAIDDSGTVLKLVCMSNDETPGLGSKVQDESFTSQFTGIEAKEITIDDIDAISGATISSKAVVAAINLAFQAFAQIQEGGIS